MERLRETLVARIGPTLEPGGGFIAPDGDRGDGQARVPAGGDRACGSPGTGGSRRAVPALGGAGRGGWLGEIPSGGIDPPAMLRLPDGTMAIACGGILTDPDRGRAKLEIATTRPNRARLDPAAGAVPSPGLPPMPAAGLAFGNHRIAP